MAVFLFAIVQSNLGGIQVQIVLVTQKKQKGDLSIYLILCSTEKKKRKKKRNVMDRLG